jgi:glycosyltransferase involved in cell wall biosynthesis
MTPPPKILLLIASLRTGGKERMALEVLTYLDRNRFTPIVGVMNAGELLAQVPSDIPIYDSLARFRGDLLGFTWRLWQAIRRERPQILYCLSYRIPAWVGRILAKLAGIPVVIYELHGIERPGQRDLDWLDRHVFEGLTDHHVAIGENMRQNLLRDGVRPEKITVIRNGVDSQRFCPLGQADDLKKQLLGLPASAPVLGCITNFRPKKNLAMLIDVFAALKPRYPDLHLVIVGDGTERIAVESYLAQQVLPDVHLVGQQYNIADWMNAFDVFALTSTSEAAPLVLLEASACGLPLVATEVGEIGLMIREGQTGYLVPSQDRTTFAARVATLLDSPDLRLEMGRAGRALVEAEYSIRASVQAREALFQRLLTHKGLAPLPYSEVRHA